MQPLREAALAGRRAFVTGASSGIGAAAARALAGAGASVVLAARRQDRLEAVAQSIEGAETCVLDVRDAGAVARALDGGSFDIVIPNAGLARGVATLATGDPADWSEMIDTNVKGVLHVLRYALPGLLQRGHGDVVLLGSVAGREVYPGGNVYCATKHAVKALYHALRQDHAGSGIRFSTIDPGLVETEFSRVRFGGDRAKAQAVYQGMTPLTPEDVADGILWAVTRPAHVDVGELVLWPRDQASTTSVKRS